MKFNKMFTLSPWVAPPLLLGSLVLALLSALVGYLLVRAGWRLSTVRQWQKRKVARPC
nr:DUF2062 domain-containing protein [Aeromonas caviae]